MLAGRLLRSRCGTAALEFAIVGPAFLSLVFAILSAGINVFYQHTLDESLRYPARRLKTPSLDGPSFVAAVCAEFSSLATDCATKLTYSVQSATYPSGFTTVLMEYK